MELFFKWIKQNLHVETFFGYSENAVKTQVWVAVSVYLLVAILKKKLNLNTELSQILHFFSDILYETIPIPQAFWQFNYRMTRAESPEQLSLLDS